MSNPITNSDLEKAARPLWETYALEMFGAIPRGKVFGMQVWEDPTMEGDRIKLVSGGNVGVPREGERICGRCRGNGMTSRRVTNYPGYAVCEPCHGTGVRPVQQQ